MNPRPKFVPHIPKDVSLNPQFDTISVKMKDLFVQFVTKSSRQQFIKQLLDTAVNNSLVPGKSPSPLQTDPLPSFINSGKNPMNAPPVGRRSARPALMSLTLGPTPRPHRFGAKEQAQQGAPTLMSTIDLSRSSQAIPPLNDLLTSVLEPAALATREAALVSLLGEVQPRDPSLIKPDTPVPAAFERVCRDVLGINPLFARCLERKIFRQSKPEFIRIWKLSYCRLNKYQLVFELMRTQNQRYLSRENFEVVVADFVANLEDFAMLKGEEAFRNRFIKTVVELVFLKNDLDQDGKLQLRDFVFSSFLENVDGVHAKADLSEKFHYFDYEHFYVFCYLFNELDDDDDGLIGRAELEKYSRHNISSIAIDRIFSGVAIRFSNAGKSVSSIDFCDFIRFIVYEEDKMTAPAIAFWFKILDLDGDGVLSAFELEKFFRINQKRMLAIEGSFYEWKDIMCLLMDMMGVDRPHFTLADLLNRYYYAPHFINIFTNYGNFKNFIERESYITPVADPYSDFFRFYKRRYDLYTNPGQDLEPEADENMFLRD